MKLTSFKRFTVPEIILLIVFIIYILFPIGTPLPIKSLIDSSVGMMLLFVVCISLFVYTNPALGVVFIFVAYELMRRSAVGRNFMNTPSIDTYGKQSSTQHAEVKNRTNSTISQVPMDDIPRDEPVPESPHSFVHQTLEEEIINIQAPIGRSDPLQMTSASFQPVSSNLKNASLV